MYLWSVAYIPGWLASLVVSYTHHFLEQLLQFLIDRRLFSYLLNRQVLRHRWPLDKVHKDKVNEGQYFNVAFNSYLVVSGCPEGFQLVVEGESICYFVSSTNEKYDWQNAKITCQNRNASLAELNTDAKFNAVETLMKTYGMTLYGFYDHYYFSKRNKCRLF